MTEPSIFNETFDEVRFIDVDDPKFVNVKNLFPGHVPGEYLRPATPGYRSLTRSTYVFPRRTDTGKVRYLGPVHGIPWRVLRETKLFISYTVDNFGKSTFSYQTPAQAKEVSYPRGGEYKMYEYIAYIEYDRKVIDPKDFNTTVVDLRELVIFHAKDLDAYDEFDRRFYDDGNSVIRHEVVHAPNEPARYDVGGGKQLYYIPAGSIQTVDLSKIRWSGESVGIHVSGIDGSVFISFGEPIEERFNQAVFSWDDSIVLVRSGHFRSLTDALRVHTTDFYKYF